MISKKTLAAALVALTAAGAAVPASASGLSLQFSFGGTPGVGYGHPWAYPTPHWQVRKLTTDQVRWVLRNQGYRFIYFLDTNGPTYGLTARHHGRKYYLVVNAFSGHVINRYPI
jgi:hypothetical protein